MERHASGRLVVNRRTFLLRAAGGITLGLLAACGPAAPQAWAPQPTAEARLNVPQTISTAGAATAQPQAQAAPTAARAEPKGRFNYIWHTTISPAWFDPQEYPPQITPYNFGYALHDALVKHLPGQPFAPSLAESYEIAPDNRSATFKLRPGIKFHDGNPVTPEDVQFTYYKYSGANARILHDKLDRIEIPDNRTITFRFNAPFLDFLTIYGSPSSGAGWIVPKAYYEKVGPNGFKQQPIGAGPYRFVRQAAGNDVEFEAFTDYWRKVPNVKTIVIRGIPEMSTRVALLKTGEVDVSLTIQGELLQSLKNDPSVRLTAINSAATWLEMTAYDRPDSPLKDVRVRKAISLAVDRQALNDAQFGGLSPVEGNWIPEEFQGSIKR